MRSVFRLPSWFAACAGVLVACASMDLAAGGAVNGGDPAGVLCAAPLDGALDLMRALALAQCLQPELRASAARVAARAAELAQARAAFMPELSLPGTVDRMPGTTHMQGGVELRWTVYDAGRRTAARDAAQAALHGAQREHEALRQQVFGRVGRRYLEAVEADAAVRGSTRSVRRHQRSRDVAQRRAQAGLVADNDRLRAEAALAQAALMHARHVGAAGEAGVALGLAIGMPVAAPVSLAHGVEPGESADVAPLEEWLALARARHPAIAAARARGEAAQASIAEARACGGPTVQLALSHQRDAVQSVNNAALQWQLPLFDGGRCAQQVVAAKARHAEARAEVQRVTQESMGAVAVAHAQALSARGQLAQARAWHDAARAALASSRRRYAAGVADIGELLGAEDAMDEASKARRQGLAQWRGAELRLLAAAGAFDAVAD